MHGKVWGDGKGGEWELVRGEITGGLGYIRVAVYSNPAVYQRVGVQTQVLRGQTMAPVERMLVAIGGRPL